MSDTITFSGLTAYLSPGFREPRLIPILAVSHLTRSNINRYSNMGKAGDPVTLTCFVDEADAATAQTVIDSWQALEGTEATLSWSIGGTADSTTNCLLQRVEVVSRWAAIRAFTATFLKVA